MIKSLRRALLIGLVIVACIAFSRDGVAQDDAGQLPQQPSLLDSSDNKRPASDPHATPFYWDSYRDSLRDCRERRIRVARALWLDLPTLQAQTEEIERNKRLEAESQPTPLSGLERYYHDRWMLDSYQPFPALRFTHLGGGEKAFYEGQIGYEHFWDLQQEWIPRYSLSLGFDSAVKAREMRDNRSLDIRRANALEFGLGLHHRRGSYIKDGWRFALNFFYDDAALSGERRRMYGSFLEIGRYSLVENKALGELVNSKFDDDEESAPSRVLFTPRCRRMTR